MKSIREANFDDCMRRFQSSTQAHILVSGMDLEMVFLYGRLTAYGMQNGFDTFDVTKGRTSSPQSAWRKDIAQVLCEEGFVRNDINKNWFRMAMLYNMVCDESRFPIAIGGIKTNQMYERMVPVTEETIRTVRERIREVLNDEEFEVIESRFSGKNVLIDQDVCRKLGISQERLNALEISAVKKMRKINFPLILT